MVRCFHKKEECKKKCKGQSLSLFKRMRKPIWLGEDFELENEKEGIDVKYFFKKHKTGLTNASVGVKVRGKTQI